MTKPAESDRNLVPTSTGAAKATSLVPSVQSIITKRGAVVSEVDFPGPLDWDVGADRSDLADELVPHDERVPHGAVAVPDAVVGAAEARGEHLDHGLAGSRREEVPLLHTDVAGPVEHGSVPGAHPTDCPL